MYLAKIKIFTQVTYKYLTTLLDIDPEFDEVELTVENKVLMVKKAEKTN